MSSINYIVGLIALIILVGLVLRYGNSSNALAKDFNGILGTLTLQGASNYYGPTQ